MKNWHNRFLVLMLLVMVALAAIAVKVDAEEINPIVHGTMRVKAAYIWNAYGAFVDGYDGQFIGVQYYPPNTFQFDFEIGLIILRWIFLDAELITFNGIADDPGLNGIWSPFQVDYGLRVGVEHWGVRIGLEHWCYHPGLIYGQPYPGKYGGVTSVYVEFDTERLRSGR